MSLSIKADSFLELQRAEPELEGASYKPWLREVGAKLLLRIMDRVRRFVWPFNYHLQHEKAT